MKKSERMDSVLKLADKAEQQAAERFAASQRNANKQRRKLDELKQYYHEYSAASSAAGAGLDLRRLQETRQFMSKLATAIGMQQEQVDKAERNMQGERQQWMSTRQRSMSLEKLTERYQQSEAQEADRREQFVADDMAAQRFLWNRSMPVL